MSSRNDMTAEFTRNRTAAKLESAAELQRGASKVVEYSGCFCMNAAVYGQRGSTCRLLRARKFQRRSRHARGEAAALRNGSGTSV